MNACQRGVHSPTPSSRSKRRQEGADWHAEDEEDGCQLRGVLALGQGHRRQSFGEGAVESAPVFPRPAPLVEVEPQGQALPGEVIKVAALPSVDAAGGKITGGQDPTA